MRAASIRIYSQSIQLTAEGTPHRGPGVIERFTMPVSELVKEYSLDEALDTIRKNGKVLSKYNNFIGGKWVAPLKGKYFVDHSPINGEPIAEIAKSTPEDVETALDAAHAAKKAWAHTSPAARAAILNKIADVMEENLEVLAIAETIDNGKPIRETRNADVPLSIDHFRYFASCIRAEEGALGEIDNDTVAYHFKEPLGVVGQIIPWNFPLLMAAWKLAPAVGSRELHRHQTGVQHASQPAGSDGPDRRYSAAGRAQRHHRPGRRDRQSAGIKFAHCQDRFHRRNHHRPPDYAVRLRADHPADA